MGIVLVPLSLVNSWAALIGYGIFVGSSMRPIDSFNAMKPIFIKNRIQ